MASGKIYTEENGWLDFTPIPVPTAYHCQVTVGDSVYVVGGWRKIHPEFTGDTFKLTLSSKWKQWVKQSSLSTPRSAHGCAEWDGGILAVGGVRIGGILSSVEKYNPVSNKWSTFTPLPTVLKDMQVLVWSNDLYVFGGEDGNGPNKKVYKIKKGKDTWETLGITLDAIGWRPVSPAVTLSTIHCN